MVEILLNRDELAYEIQCMVQPFFPGEEVNYKITDGDASSSDQCVTANVSSDNQFIDNKMANIKSNEKGISEVKVNENSSIAYPQVKKDSGISSLVICVRFIGADKIEIIIGDECTVIENCTERLDRKNSVKRALYKMLSKRTGTELPWGILTGIRPSKLAVSDLLAGKSETEAKDTLRNEYFVTEEKCELAVSIAKKELEVLSPLDVDNGYSLYIGIPFCPTTCLYCSFTSYPLASYKALVDKYLDALEIEINAVAEMFKDKPLNSIYIGGGTPTTLSAEQMERLLTLVDEKFDRSHCLEFTVEAGRPDSITKDKLMVIKNHGVNRLSINPQTMKQETLDFIGRHHTVEDIKEAYALAKSLGFETINMDLILGLPGEGVEDVKNTMEEIKKLSPQNLTVHSLAIKRASRLGMKLSELRAKGEYENPFDIENSPLHQQITADAAREMGMNPYYMYRQKNIAGNLENTGYSLPGHEGIYNILIMEEVQTIVALGAGTVTKRVYGNGRIERCDNVKDVPLYIEKIDEMIERKRKLFGE